MPSNDGIGIDLGIKELAVCSDKHNYENVNKTQKVKKLEKRKRRLQRSIFRKYEKNKTEGDKAEQDVYIMGENQPLQTYTGKVIAVYHRLNDNEDKWIVSSKDKNFTDEEILNAIEFQEKYFDGQLIR